MMPSVRIMVVEQGRGVWGAQRYLLRLAPLLAHQGFDLVLAGPPQLELADAWTAAGLERVDLDVPVERSIRRHGDVGPISPVRLSREMLSVPRVVGDIASTIRRVGAAAVFANAHWVHLDCALAGRYRGIPVMLHLHEEAVPGTGARLRGAAVKVADASVAVSQAVANNLPLPVRGKVTVVPNGVDVDVLHPGLADPAVRRSLGATDREVLVVALTRLDPVKRIEDVIEAFARAARAVPGVSARLAVVGTTSGYPAYATDVQARARMALDDRVVFAGPRRDIADVLRASDVLVHAGVVEGMPLGLLEAQACGVPVVAYAAAGVSEAVVHGRTGFVVPPLKVEDLGWSLGRLLADPRLRVSMGRAGRDHVLTHHTLEGQADTLAALTERLVAKSSAGAA